MIIQNITFEKDQGINTKSLFYHGGAVCSKKENKLIFRKGQEEWFDTFFNAISVKTWKTECGLDDVCLKLRGQGKFVVRFGLQKCSKPVTWLGDQEICLNGDEVFVDMPFWKDIERGLVFLVLTALTDGEINGGGFCTHIAPRRSVSLGLVITHYNRKRFVIPAVRRLAQELLDDDAYSQIALAVIDNSRNLSVQELGNNKKVFLIPNANVGGSGGFARGLLFFKDKGFSHCLFMDDDASCHEESIKRTFSYWTYVLDDDVAVSGTLFEDNDPEVVLENGARWDGFGIASISAGRDVEVIEDLSEMDQSEYCADYGAWCYFSFPIQSVKYYPFPFFVRGDDILFSLQNKFKIVTILGVATWVDSFLNKQSPAAVYLSTRANLAISVYMGNASASNWLREFIRQNRDCVFSYNYSWSYATYMAYSDICCKEQLFSGDVDGGLFRKELKKLKNFEECYPLSVYFENCEKQKKLKNLKKFWMSPVRKLFLNCILLPSCFLRSDAFQKKWDPAGWKVLCCYRRIYYYNNDNESVICVTHNKVEMIKAFFRNFSMMFKLVFHYKSSEKRLKGELLNLTTENFWRGVFGI